MYVGTVSKEVSMSSVCMCGHLRHCGKIFADELSLQVGRPELSLEQLLHRGQQADLVLQGARALRDGGLQLLEGILHIARLRGG